MVLDLRMTSQRTTMVARPPAVQRPVVGLRIIANVSVVVVPLLVSFKQNGGAVAAAFTFPSSTASNTRQEVRLLQQLSCASSKSTLSSSSSSSQSDDGGSAFCNANHLFNVTRLSNADFFAVRHGQSEANVARLIASNPATATVSYGLTAVGRAAAENAARQAIKVYHRDRDEAQQQNISYYQGILILSSDFLRAKETATILANTIIQEANIPLYSIPGDKVIMANTNDDNENNNNNIGISSNIVLDVRLRERWFGAWDGTSDENYAAVWADDALSSAHTNHGVESVDSVMDRATACIVEWNDILQNKKKTQTPSDSSSSSSSSSSPPRPWMVLCVAHGDVLQILQTAFEKKNGRHHRSLPHLETAQLRPLVLWPTAADG